MTAGRAKAFHQDKKTERKAANILKRRDKPLRQFQRHLASKQVPNEPAKAPEGFQFLPHGTDELARRCKQLSKSKGLPVHMVSARPRVEIARDPSKVSYHSHRIGYHFRSEVVDEACRELEYVFHENRFIKESALREQHERKRLTEVMAKHGLHIDQPAEEEEENYEQRRAAITEQFPNIPEDDLKGLLEHAWQKGTKRVGNQTELSLSRRAQLATIAGIRHQYTDYDKLLRAFDRQTARTIVEEATLKKVMEWRGENSQADDDDNELVEVLNQLIIIDDDDGIVQDGGDADDEDSATGLDAGDVTDASDASVQITYTRIATEEIERDITGQNVRQHQVELQQGIRNVEYHDMDARQKIGYVRQQMRDARGMVPSSNHGTVPSKTFGARLTGNTDIVCVNVNDHQRSDGQVMIDGQLFKRDAAHESGSRQAIYQDPRSPHHFIPNGYENPLDYRSAPHGRWPPQTLWQARPVVASIEPADDHPRNAAVSTPMGGRYAPPSTHHFQPVASELPRPQKRRRIEEPDAQPWTARSSQRYHHQLQSEGAAFRVNANDGTAPPNAMLPPHRTLTKEGDAILYDTGIGRYTPSGNVRPPEVNQLRTLPHSHTIETRHSSDLMPGQSAIPYDPRTSMIIAKRQENHYTGDQSTRKQPHVREPANAQIAPIQYLPRPLGKNGRFTTIQNSRPGQHDQRIHQVVYNPGVYPETSVPPSGYTPRPLHGEPAPIQQISRGFLHPGQVAPNQGTVLANVSTIGAGPPAPAPVFPVAPTVYPYYP